jgi:predicted branched-subunit amino acid permease
VAHLPRAPAAAPRVLLGYFLADLNLLVFQKAWPSGLREPGQVAYAMGGATIWAVWQVSSIVGICAASLVPVHWGLGFAGTLSMLGLAYGLLVDRKAQLAAVVAAAAAIAAFALPLKLNILVAIAAAVVAGELMGRVQRAAQRREEVA